MSAFLKKSRFEDLIVALRADGHDVLADRVRADLDEQAGGSFAVIWLPIAVIATYSGVVLA